MFGQRSSISKSTIAVASACSVLFCAPPTLLGQSYQQTGFPRYGRPQLSELSAQATRPPAFSDTPNHTSAMSPDSWGQSAINNPHAGFGDSTGAATAGHPTLASAPHSTSAESNQRHVTNDFFSPSAVSFANATAEDKTQHDVAEPLTNTHYSRSQSPPVRFANADLANAGFANARELSQTPELPTVESPFTRKKRPQALEQIPLTNQSPPISNGDTAELPSLNAPQDAFLNNHSSSVGATPEAPPALTVPNVFPSDLAPNPLNSGAASADPFFESIDQTQFIPHQQQSVYSQPAPHCASQASGPVSNQWVVGYPDSDQSYGPPHIEEPFNIYDHGTGAPTQIQNIGQRSAHPTHRNHTIVDRGELFDHENKKKEFPPFGEIIATGRFFGGAELAFLRPHFLGNTAVSIDGPRFSESIPFDFDNETAPHVWFGFESKYGPGFELDYFTLNANSDAISETFNGVAPINTVASIAGPNRFTQLSANVLGERIDVNHSFEIETIGFNVFKDIQFKVSRIGGRFGFTYANIAQALQATVTDAGGNAIGSLDSTSDFRGFGPEFGIDYYRPVGHTPFEFITSFTGTGLFGRRDQFVNNTTGLVERRFGADEFVAVLDLTSGIQYKKTIAENRSWVARVAFVHQTWLGGGTAVDPQGDFGIKGFTFGVGYNR